MLEKAGVLDEYEEAKGPTQMHNLLELIKKEQDIYNVVFHELIRQVCYSHYSYDSVITVAYYG